MISIPRGWGFRSGVGCRHEDGTHEDWGMDEAEGLSLSPNGRQVRSAITGQINDLAGASYWAMRKELPNKLSVAGELPTDNVWTKDGKANIAAFTDEALGLDQKKTPAKKEIPIAHKIIPQERTLNRLDEQEKELYKAFEGEKISEEEFKNLIYALEVKRSRAWKSRCKALGIPEEYSEEMEEGYEEENIAPEQEEAPYLVWKSKGENDDNLEDGNMFVTGYERIKDGWNSLRNMRGGFSVDKQKAAPYVGFAVIALGLLAIF